MEDKKLVVVVEDDTDARELLCIMLNTLGYQTKAYVSGEKALEALEETSPNLFMLDIMMPGMDGYELLQSIKAKPSLSSVPCVMVTAKDQDDDMMEGYKYGADYYITKPYTMKQLKYALELYL